jgi:hypothetical protein
MFVRSEAIGVSSEGLYRERYKIAGITSRTPTLGGEGTGPNGTVREF